MLDLLRLPWVAHPKPHVYPPNPLFCLHGNLQIPKQIRDALNLSPGCAADFAVNCEGDVVIHKSGAGAGGEPDRFERARGKADVKWQTDQLMALLHGE